MSEGRSPRTPVRAAVATAVLALVLGGCGTTEPTPVGSSPTPSTPPTTSPATSPAASLSPSPSPTDGRVERLFVYFAQDQLPPSGGLVEAQVTEEPTPEGNIAARLRVLGRTPAPQGEDQRYSNQLFSSRTKPTVNEVRIEGDLARVDFTVPNGDWGVPGSAASLALLGQLVYTATEEPGIRRVLLTENGGKPTTIDQVSIDAPLAREDVLPYEGVKTEERIALEDDPRASTATTRIEEVAGGIRFIIELKANETPAEGFWSPRTQASLRPNDLNGNGLERAKSVLQVAVGGARTTFDGYRVVTEGIGIQDIDRSPLRFVRLTQRGPAVTGLAYELGIDDARPWRVSLEPGQPGTMRLIVDVGGHPQAISDSVAVYGPKPGDQVSRTFTLTGTARAFEAHVAWRIKDSAEREVATGFVIASLGSSPVWGTLTTEVKIPDNVSGAVTLEVFWASPRDGADVGRVAIPLRVR